jgi:chromosome partitioning protein
MDWNPNGSKTNPNNTPPSSGPRRILIRLLVANQRGGVGKTTTAVNLSWYLAERGYRTLLIDTDSQGSVALMLNLRPLHYFSQFLLSACSFEQSVIHVKTGLDVMCGSKHALEAESALGQISARESALETSLQPFECRYDAVILDASPSLSLVQTCALMYARNVIIPVNMDFLSLNGAQAAYETIQLLNSLFNAHIRPIGLLPCQVNRRLSITRLVEQGLQTMSQALGVPLLPGIRTDQSVNKAFLARKAVVEYDPDARSAQDYVAAFDKMLSVLEELGYGQIERNI